MDGEQPVSVLEGLLAVKGEQLLRHRGPAGGQPRRRRGPAPGGAGTGVPALAGDTRRSRGVTCAGRCTTWPRTAGAARAPGARASDGRLAVGLEEPDRVGAAVRGVRGGRPASGSTGSTPSGSPADISSRRARRSGSTPGITCQSRWSPIQTRGRGAHRVPLAAAHERQPGAAVAADSGGVPAAQRVSVATHSTWWVIGNASNARRLSSRQPAASSRPRSRASVAGSQET
jgi:hypothetical protein